MLHRYLPLLLLSVVLLDAAEEKLVQATFNQRNDSLGMRWDVQPDGQVNDGTNDCFDSGLMLQVGGMNFQPQKQQQTADGSELVLSGRLGSVEVVRRIRLDAKRNVLRYLEIITNPGNAKQQVALRLVSNLGSPCQQVVWSDGKVQSGAALPKGCVGLAAIQQPQQQRPSVVWLIGEARAASAPQVNVANNHQFQFTWNVALAPKQTRVILHMVMQRRNLNPAQVPDMVKPLWKGGPVKPDLPRSMQSQVVNFRLVGGDGDETDLESFRLPIIARLLERAGADDAGTMDLVGVGRSEAERMRGRLSGGPLNVTTPQGPVSVTVDELAGGEGGDPIALLHLRTGESLAVTRIEGNLALETEAGVSLPVDPVRMLWMAARIRREDQKPPEGQQGLLELVDGTRLGLADIAIVVPLICVWGTIEMPLARIARIARVVEPTPAWLVTCDDGSIFRAIPAAGELVVTTRRFGRQTVPVGTIAAFQHATAKPPAEDEPEDGGRIANGDHFAGGLAGPTLVLTAGGQDSAVPVERIAAIERPEEGSGLALVLRDGSRLVGAPAGGSVGFIAGGCTVRVPTERILGWKARVKAAAEGAAKDAEAGGPTPPSGTGPTPPAAAQGGAP